MSKVWYFLLGLLNSYITVSKKILFIYFFEICKSFLRIARVEGQKYTLNSGDPTNTNISYPSLNLLFIVEIMHTIFVCKNETWREFFAGCSLTVQYLYWSWNFPASNPACHNTPMVTWWLVTICSFCFMQTSFSQTFIITLM